MGYLVHHAIVVTGSRWDDDMPSIDDARVAAVDCGCLASAVVGPAVNAYYSFFVAPDGSKEGWEESDTGDARREAFIAWLRQHEEEGWFDWAEVRFSPDDDAAEVTHHAWERRGQ